VIRSTAAAAAQALELLRRGGIDTLCVHGDGDHAAAILRAAREALIDAGVAIAAPSASHRKL
jgi:lactam utilization protein B